MIRYVQEISALNYIHDSVYVCMRMHIYILHNIIVNFLSQIQQEFDCVVANQHATFLSIKLRWLELQPKLLELAYTEENRHLASILDTPKEEMDEG